MSIESFFYMVEIRLNDIAIKIEILIVNLSIMISKTSEAIIERFIIQIVLSVYAYFTFIFFSQFS